MFRLYFRKNPPFSCKFSLKKTFYFRFIKDCFNFFQNILQENIMSKHIKLAKIMDLMTIYCEKHIFLRFSRVMPKQVLNHLNCEYSTERQGPFAAISAKIDLFLANLGLKNHYFIDYQKLSKLVFLTTIENILQKKLCLNTQDSLKLSFFLP